MAKPAAFLVTFVVKKGSQKCRHFWEEETNVFVPWFPPEMIEVAAKGLQGHLDSYEKSAGYHYAICLRADDVPIGYVNVGDGESRDFGYGLRSDFWQQGIVTEACAAVVERVRMAGIGLSHSDP